MSLAIMTMTRWATARGVSMRAPDGGTLAQPKILSKNVRHSVFSKAGRWLRVTKTKARTQASPRQIAQLAPRTTTRPSSRPSDDKSPHGTAARGRLAWRAEGNLHGAEGNLHGVEGMWGGRDVGRARCGFTGGMSGGMWVGHAVGRARRGSGTMRVGRGKDSERPPRRETSRSPTRPLSRATAGGHVRVTVRRRASRRLHARHAARWSDAGFEGIPVRAAISAWLTASHPNSEVK